MYIHVYIYIYIYTYIYVYTGRGNAGCRVVLRSCALFGADWPAKIAPVDELFHGGWRKKREETRNGGEQGGRGRTTGMPEWRRGWPVRSRRQIRGVARARRAEGVASRFATGWKPRASGTSGGVEVGA